MSTGLFALNAHSDVVQMASGLVFALSAVPFFILGLREAWK